MSKKREKTDNKKMALVFAVVVSILYFIGMKEFFILILGKPVLFGVVDAYVLICPVVAVVFVAAYFIACKAYGVIELNTVENEATVTQYPEDYKKLFFAEKIRLFLIAWLPYYLIRFPGNYDPDSIWQLMEGYGLAVSRDHHPYFDTMIFTFFWKLGEVLGSNFWSLLFYSVIQMGLMAFLCTSILFWLSKAGLKEKHISFCKYFWAFYPVVPMFVPVMTKDMIHGVFFLAFFSMYIQIVRTGGKCLKKNTFSLLFFLIIILTMLTKKTGVYVVAISLVMLLFITGKQRLRLLVVGVLSVLIFEVGWTSALKAMNVVPGEEQEMMSVPSQQVAYYIKEKADEIKPEEWDILGKVYSSPETMGEAYIPIIADNTKNRWKNEADKADKIDFYRWYIKKFCEYPVIFMDAFMANITPLLHVDFYSMKTESLLFYRDCVPTSETAGVIEETYSTWEWCVATPDEIHELMLSSYRYEIPKFFSRAFTVICVGVMTVFSPFFSKATVAMWIPLFVFLYGLYKRNGKIIISLVPVLLTTLTLMAGPTLLPRYFVNSVYTLPLVCILPFLLGQEEQKTTHVTDHR